MPGPLAVRVAAVALLLSASAIDASAQSVTPITIPGKFDTATEHVLIPVTIGGHQFWCNAETGFSALVALDQAKAVHAGLRVAPAIATPDGNPPAAGDSSTTATVVVGGVAFADHPIILRQLPEEAPEMDCIMGVALLRRFIVEFDHVTPRIVLHERATYRPREGADRVPLVFGSNPNVPYVDLQLTLGQDSRLPLRVIPDTGAAFYGAVLVGDAVARVQSQLSAVPAVTHSDARVTQLLAARPAAIRVGSDTDIGLGARLDWKPLRHVGFVAGYSLVSFKVKRDVGPYEFSAKQSAGGPVVGIGLYFCTA